MIIIAIKSRIVISMAGEIEETDDIEDDSNRNADSSRLGKAVEHLVAASCILASNLRLNVSTAFTDDEGVDLVFHRRGHSATLAVQVKSRTTTASVVRREQFIGDVRQVTFRPRDSLWMLFVVVDASKAALQTVWFVPSNDFDRLASRLRSGKVRRIAASLKPDTKDQWQRYRMEFADLPRSVLAKLTEMERTAR